MVKDYKKHSIVCKRYERTKKGKLVRIYRNMLSRVKGIQKKNIHIYEGLPIVEKEVFYKWALNNKDYNLLYDKWVELNYDRMDAPSIDRINSKKGYVLDNMRWITFRQNCSLGGKASPGAHKK